MVLPEGVDHHDVRVAHSGHGAGLGDERLTSAAVPEDRLVDDLHRDVSAQGEILGEVHRAHGAAREHVADAIGVFDHFAGRKRVIVGRDGWDVDGRVEQRPPRGVPGVACGFHGGLRHVCPCASAHG